ncbi:hypothetical protein ACFVSN_40685 [Kitasatospora sp. NPDC057904]|uniref:hypothetical protein n=1 Tax=Kitasatospora sp. NPDC057904 TaxID=3346275 RepID=UPI0036DD2FFE
MTDKTPQGDTQGTRVKLGPVSDAEEAQPGTLTLTYADGVPTLTVSGGIAIPTGITVLDQSGNAVARYTAGPQENEPPEESEATAAAGQTRLNPNDALYVTAIHTNTR